VRISALLRGLSNDDQSVIQAGGAARPLAATKWRKCSHSRNTENGMKFLLKKQEFTVLQCRVGHSLPYSAVRKVVIAYLRCCEKMKAAE
jgi:hypothetical protein